MQATASGAFTLPELRTWRVYHADVVKGSFLTPSRWEAQSPERLRQTITSDAATKAMSPWTSLGVCETHVFPCELFGGVEQHKHV